jgi:hypothetical protein
MMAPKSQSKKASEERAAMFIRAHLVGAMVEARRHYAKKPDIAAAIRSLSIRLIKQSYRETDARFKTGRNR